MLHFCQKLRLAAFVTIFFALTLHTYAQSSGSATINGTVVDPSGAVVANATVEIRNAVSAFSRSVKADSAGAFSFPNVPFNPYHMTVSCRRFHRDRAGCGSPLGCAFERQTHPASCRINHGK